MNNDFKKAYPMGRSNTPYLDQPDVITVNAATAAIDLSDYKASNCIIRTLYTGALALTLTNPQPGVTYTIIHTEAGVSNHVTTFSGATINATGNNVATSNAIEETLVLLCVSATRLEVINNMGAVALS